MLFEPRVLDLERQARDFYRTNDPGHDWAHIERVRRACEHIGGEVGADLALLIPAAILHDLVNLPKNHPDRAKASTASAAEAEKVLASAGYSPDEIRLIQAIILEHSYTLGRQPSSLESAVLQDADRLDALGAIGIMRATTCGCRLNASYYDLDDPFAVARPLDDQAYTLDHFPVKLFRLGDSLNTEAGRREAVERIAFMRSFMAQLEREISRDR